MPEYLAVGHVTHDRVGRGSLPGGSAYYSAVTARAMGLKPSLWTSLGADFAHEQVLSGIAVHNTPGPATTTFENIYGDGVRKQWVHALATTLAPDTLPEVLRGSAVVHLAPVIDEVPLALAPCFAGALVGLGVQGWVRSLEGSGRVAAKRWEPDPCLLEAVDVAVLSDAEADLQADLVERLVARIELVALTHGEQGSTLFVRGEPLRVPAARAIEVDPTGAGDVYTAALLICLARGLAPPAAAEAAAVAAAAIVEAPGAAGAARIADRLGPTGGRLAPRS